MVYFQGFYLEPKGFHMQLIDVFAQHSTFVFELEDSYEVLPIRLLFFFANFIIATTAADY